MSGVMIAKNIGIRQRIQTKKGLYFLQKSPPALPASSMAKADNYRVGRNPPGHSGRKSRMTTLEIGAKLYGTPGGGTVRSKNLSERGRIVCPHCYLAVVFDEYFPFPECGKDLCLYCYEGGCPACDLVDDSHEGGVE